jgi:hypothetical protein
MRKVALVVALMFVATAAWAGPNDKSKNALINPASCRGSTEWDNKIVKATFSGGSSTMKIKASNLGVTGDIYCITFAEGYIAALGPLVGATAVVTKGTVSDGKLMIKANPGAVDPASIPGGVVTVGDLLNFHTSLECYKDTTSWDWEAECQGMKLTKDPTAKDDGFVGICKFFVPLLDARPMFSKLPDGQVYDPGSPYGGLNPLAIIGSGFFSSKATDLCDAP